MSKRKARCSHKTTQFDWGIDADKQVAIRKWCLGCSGTLSLGDSSDSTPEVGIEIRAARVESNERLGLAKRWRRAEKSGWMANLQGLAPTVDSADHQAGWLAAQIFDRHQEHEPSDIEQPGQADQSSDEPIADGAPSEAQPSKLDGIDQGEPEQPVEPELVDVDDETTHVGDGPRTGGRS